MNGYFDTSALVANYHEEAGSKRVMSLLSEDGGRHVISRLGYLEAHSAFALKVRSGEIGDDAFEMLRRRFRADVAGNSLLVVRVLRRHYDGAEKLLLQHARTEKLRAADALHLAIALDLLAMRIVDTFVCSDGPLLKVAKIEGMNVVNPTEG